LSDKELRVNGLRVLENKDKGARHKDRGNLLTSAAVLPCCSAAVLRFVEFIGFILLVRG
jgi:hypothetical protein